MSRLINLGTAPRPDLISSILELTLKYSVRTWSPRFMDKLYAGSNPIGAISELIIGVLNTNSHVYHVSPVFTLIEIRVLEQMCSLVGFNTDAGSSRGVFCPGGSYSNLHAMVTARNIKFKEMISDGVNCPCSPQSSYKYRNNLGPLSIFTSAHSHYSILKSAITLGIGTRHVYQVPTDSHGQMDSNALETLLTLSILKGERPFFICATAGTTVLGAFDPLLDIYRISTSHDCWFHVDGSWGGSCVFSDTHKHKMNGAQFADSVVINPHKILGVPLLCSALLMKDPLALNIANSTNAAYLFHSTDDDDDDDDHNKLDLGDGTIGCGRRPDAFKMMMSWVYYGKDGFAARIDTAISNALYLRDKLLVSSNHQHQSSTTTAKSTTTTYNGRFELVERDPSFTNVCFWYFPKDISKDEISKLRETKYEEYVRLVGGYTKKIHSRLHQDGSFMVDYAPLQVYEKDGTVRELPVFWRVVFNHPRLKTTDIDELLSTIDNYGSEVPFYNQ